jgi:hypothetical protein
MRDFIELFVSYIVAVSRLLLLTLLCFISGMHQIIFNRVEVCNVGLYYLPLRFDRDKISYINNLNMSNLYLIQPYEDENYEEGEDFQDEQE